MASDPPNSSPFSRNRLNFCRIPNLESTLLALVLKRSFKVEVDGKTTKYKAKQHLEPTAAADRRPASGSSSLHSSPPASGSSSWTGGGTRSGGSLLVTPTRGSQPSPFSLEATDTVAPATSPLSKVPSETVYVPQVLHDNGTAMYGTGTAYKDFHHAAQFMATNALIPEPATRAAGASDVVAETGWRSTTAGQQLHAMGIAVPTGDASPNLEFGGEMGSGKGENQWTDADLLKFSAVFLGEQGRAWREAVEKNELLP